MSDRQFPTPGPNEQVPAWKEYEQLREAIDAYLRHDPDDPAWDDIWRALGAIPLNCPPDHAVNIKRTAITIDSVFANAFCEPIENGVDDFHRRRKQIHRVVDCQPHVPLIAPVEAGSLTRVAP